MVDEGSEEKRSVVSLNSYKSWPFYYSYPKAVMICCIVPQMEKSVELTSMPTVESMFWLLRSCCLMLMSVVSKDVQ